MNENKSQADGQAQDKLMDEIETYNPDSRTGSERNGRMTARDHPGQAGPQDTD